MAALIDYLPLAIILAPVVGATSKTGNDMTIEEQLANITARLTALERRDIPPVCDLEKEFGIKPIPPICPDMTGEGSAYQLDPAPPNPPRD